MADIVLDVQSAPSTPAAGQATIYVDTTLKVLSSKDDAGLVTNYNSVPNPMTVARGGTGVATLTAHGVLIGEGTSNVAVTSAGTANQPLLSGGASADPSFNAMTLVQTLTDGATPALDASLVPWWVTGVYRLAAGGDRTIAVPSNATNGQKIIIEHYASAGARTLSLNTGAGGFRFGTDITALTQTTSGKTDYIGCVYNGTDSKWDVVAYTKGF